MALDQVRATDHWLYRIIPPHRNQLMLRQPCKWIPWALLGNDDDGIFGEGPKSGSKWIKRWHGTLDKTHQIFNPGEISFKRFALWQLRNPLHNFSFYVIGFAWMKKLPLYQVAVISTRQVGLFKKLERATIFPMGSHSGFYIGIHMLPCLSFRLFLHNWKRLEGYMGWRTRGNFGFAFRFKSNNPT